MKKKMFVLTHDYWHHEDSIKPLIDTLSRDEYDVTFTVNPEEYMNDNFDLFLSFKDPIENDQIPTPVWCNDKWTDKFMNDVKAGMGTILFHAALTDLPENHIILKNIIKRTFISHPEQCKVSFVPKENHPVLEGISGFEFPENDEHYVMEMLDGTDTEVIAETHSKNGIQPGVWVHIYGKGKICCIVPAHSTANLTCAQFVKLVSNAITWVEK